MLYYQLVGEYAVKMLNSNYAKKICIFEYNLSWQNRKDIECEI